MSRLFHPREFEPLKLEVRNQFDWAVDDGEHHPEGVAFMVGDRIIGGHARNRVRVTAIADALTYLHENFAVAALGAGQHPDRMVVMTRARENGQEPRDPSPSLLRDIRAHLKPDKEARITVLVLSDSGTAAKTLEI